MKNIASYIFPLLLIIVGGGLLIIGMQQGQNAWVLLGAGLALLAGVVALLLQLGIISRQVGMIVGILFAVIAIGLAYRNYRSVVEVIEFNERKAQSDKLVIQGLKDIRTAELGYKEATGNFTGSIDVLTNFLKNGTIPMVKSIGQVPDSLTELKALELKLIVRDTILAPALDSLFMTKKALEGRAYPFDLNTFANSPVSKKPYLLRAGVINSSGRSVPVFMARDPQPIVAGDTLLVGNLEKYSVAGNWTGE